MNTKTAMITIAGRPNVGKSTLANALVGEKIAIVSHKPQTTRNRICAIVDRGDTQLVFIDTPGFHRPRTKLGDYMVNVVNQSVADVDAVIPLVEPIANVGPQEQELIEKIKEAKVPAILVINKIDTVEKETLLPVIAAYKDLLDFTDVIPISAKWHDGLDSLMQVCENFAQPGPFMFPEGISTDMPEKQVMAEIIREKLLCYFDQLARREKSETVTLPFSLSALAEYISADRSAMMRELQKLKEEGVVQTENRRVTILP